MALSAKSSLSLSTSMDGDSINSMDSPFPCLITFVKKFFNVQPKGPLVQLKTVSFRPVAGCLGEEADLHLATPAFQMVVESNKGLF